MNMQKGDPCLVTGISGYLASWIGKYLLEEGYWVRGTVRSLKNIEQLEKMHQILPGVEFVEADLRREDGWDRAVEGVKWVFHVASPQAVNSENDRTGGATKGTRYLMSAALQSNTVQKIVVTSSEAAVAYGHPASKTTFTEDDWTDPNSNDYFRSKTLAEKLAWEMAENPKLNRNGVALSTINPSMILGPSLIPWGRYSTETVKNIAEGKTPFTLEMVAHFVDVRDCAKMHIAIMKNPDTDGHRHLCFSAKGKTTDLVRILREDYAPQGFRIRTRTVPKAVVWLMKFFSKDAASIYTRLGTPAFYKTKYPDVYEYEYNDVRQMVQDTMDSLIANKLLAL